MTKPVYDAWVIKALNKRVIAHNEAETDPRRRLRLADVKTVHGRGWRDKESAMAKVDAFVDHLAKAEDFEEWKHRRDNGGRFAPKGGGKSPERHRADMERDDQYRAAHTQVIPETRFTTLGAPLAGLAGVGLGAASWGSGLANRAFSGTGRRVAGAVAGNAAKVAVGVPVLLATTATRPLLGRAALAFGLRPPSREAYRRFVRGSANGADHGARVAADLGMRAWTAARTRVLAAARKTGGPKAVWLAGAAVPGVAYGTGLYHAAGAVGPVLDSLFPRRVDKVDAGAALVKRMAQGEDLLAAVAGSEELALVKAAYLQDLAKATVPSAASMARIANQAISRFQRRIGPAVVRYGTGKVRRAIVGASGRAIAGATAAAAGGLAAGGATYAAGNPYRDAEGRFTSREKAAFMVGVAGGLASGTAVVLGLRRGNMKAASAVIRDVADKARGNLDQFQARVERELTARAQKTGISVGGNIDLTREFPEVGRKARIALPTKSMTLAETRNRVGKQFDDDIAAAAGSPANWMRLQIDEAHARQVAAVTKEAMTLSGPNKGAFKAGWDQKRLDRAVKTLGDVRDKAKLEAEKSLSDHTAVGQALKTDLGELKDFLGRANLARGTAGTEALAVPTAVLKLDGKAQKKVDRFLELGREYAAAHKASIETIKTGDPDELALHRARDAAAKAVPEIEKKLKQATKAFDDLVEEMKHQTQASGHTTLAQAAADHAKIPMPKIVDEVTTSGLRLAGQPPKGEAIFLKPPPDEAALRQVRARILDEVDTRFAQTAKIEALQVRKIAEAEVSRALGQLRELAPATLPEGAGAALMRAAEAAGRYKAEVLKDLKKVPKLLDRGLHHQASAWLTSISNSAVKLRGRARELLSGIAYDKQSDGTWKFSPKKASLKTLGLLSATGVIKITDDALLPQWGDRWKRPGKELKPVSEIQSNGDGRIGVTFVDANDGQRKWASGYEIKGGVETPLRFGTLYERPGQQQGQQRDQGRRENAFQPENDASRQTIGKAISAAFQAKKIENGDADDAGRFQFLGKGGVPNEVRAGNAEALSVRRRAIARMRRQERDSLGQNDYFKALSSLFDKDARLLTLDDRVDLFFGKGGIAAGADANTGIKQRVRNELDRWRDFANQDQRNDMRRLVGTLHLRGDLNDSEAKSAYGIISSRPIRGATADTPVVTPTAPKVPVLSARAASAPEVKIRLDKFGSEILSAVNSYSFDEQQSAQWQRTLRGFGASDDPQKQRQSFSNQIAELAGDLYEIERARNQALDETELLGLVRRRMLNSIKSTGRILIEKLDAGAGLAKAWDESKFVRHAKGSIAGGEFAPKGGHGERAGRVAEGLAASRAHTGEERSPFEPVRALGNLGSIASSTAAWQAAERFLPAGGRIVARAGRFGVKLAASGVAGSAGKVGGEAVANAGYKVAGKPSPGTYEEPLRPAIEESMRLAGNILGTLGGAAAGAAGGPAGSFAGGVAGAVAGEEAGGAVYRFVTSRHGEEAAARIQRFFQP